LQEPKPEGKAGSRKLECGSRPATGSRIVRGFLTCLCHRGGGANDCFSPTALAEASAAFAKADCKIPDRAIMNSQPLRFVSSLNLLQGTSEGEEAATPGQPVALSAFLDVFPTSDSLSRISSSAAGSAAIIWPSQKFSRFAEDTFFQNRVRSNRKNARRCAETVEECTSLWIALEN